MKKSTSRVRHPVKSRISLVERAIGSVVFPKRSNGLIDILKDQHPPLPVHLPPIADFRVKRPSQKFEERRKTRNQHHENDDVPLVDGDDEPNPFSYPKNVEQYVEMLDNFKAKDRERQQNVPTLMKGTKGFKQSQTLLRRIKPFLQPTFKPSLIQDYKQVIWRAQHGLGINHLQKVSRKMHSEYIMQRKEIYYLKRAVRSRKLALERIQKSKELEEESLSKYEWLTSFTKEAFETFLKENDAATHQASKKSEQTLKEKLDKSLKVRQLCIQINQCKSDIAETNDCLRECKSYMRFMDDIGREIMRKDEEEEHRAQRREEQVKEELVECMKQGMTLKEAKDVVRRKANIYTAEVSAEDQEQTGKSQEEDHPIELQSGSTQFVADLSRAVRRNIGLPEEKTEPPPEPEPKGKKAKREFRKLRKLKGKALPTPNEIASSLVTRQESRLNSVTAKHEKATFGLQLDPVSKEQKQTKLSMEDTGKEDEDGYNETALLNSLDLVPGSEGSDRKELANLCLTRPSHLLSIYSDMEEANLSLIQHSQASEEMLEKVQREISKARKQLNHRGKLLRDEISSMQAGIDMDEQRAKALGMLFEMFTGGNYDVRKQQKLYRILQRHIVKVYQAAVGTVDHHLNPTMMLTSVEKNFEDLMKEIETMPVEVVLQISRELDKERREDERVEQIQRKRDLYGQRKSVSIARAEAPIRQKKGKPLLFRSRPPKAIIRLSQAELEKKAEEDEFNYFFGP